MGFLTENAGMISQGAGAISTIAGSMISARGEKAAGNAAANADLYNAGVASTNADIALQNATYAGQAGEVAVGIRGMETAAAVGGIKAGQAASGVDVTSQSATNVRASESARGMFDALTIRSNAAKEAYGFQTASADDRAAAANFRNQAVYDRQAGKVKARATMLSGLGQAGSNFSDYMMKNSINKSETTGGGEQTATSGSSTYYPKSDTWIDWK